MPAVSTTSVWPMAITPTTTTCCRIRERFWPVRNLSVCAAKNAHASSSATRGPAFAPSCRLLAPARIQAGRGVLALHAFHRLVGDQRHAGIGDTRGFLACPGVLDRRLDAERRHPERVLLRGGGDLAGLDVAHAGAAAVDRDDQDVPVA